MITFIETENRILGGSRKSYGLMIKNFTLGWWKILMRDKDCTRMRMNLVPLNSTLKKGWNGKFMYILPQFNTLSVGTFSDRVFIVRDTYCDNIFIAYLKGWNTHSK